MTSNHNQQLDQIEEKLLQKTNNKKKKMKVSGKGIFKLSKIIKDKNTQNQNIDTHRDLEGQNA